MTELQKLQLEYGLALNKLNKAKYERRKLIRALEDAKSQIIALCSVDDVPDSVNEALRNTVPMRKARRYHYGVTI